MAPPSILFINRVFPPDRGATGRCLADLATRLAVAGWRVTVLADGAPDEHAPHEHATAPAGVQVVRAGAPRRSDRVPTAVACAGTLGRLLARALTLPDHDVIVTLTDPPLLALLGPLLAARRGAATIHWCHDLYPDLLPVLGVHLPRPVQVGLRVLSRRAMASHDAVVAIGDCMAGHLAATGIPHPRLTVIPNWADPSIHPVERATNPFRRHLDLGDRFTVAYAGNFGLAHPLGAVLDAAARLAHSAPDIVFLLIGDGRGRPAVERAVAERRLDNVRLLPFQPAERIAESLGAADLHLATMAEAAAGLLVPSKVASALAAGRPCLLLGPAASTAARSLVDGGCGAVLAPDDGAALAQATAAFAAAFTHDPAAWRESGRRAVMVARRHDAEAAAAQFHTLARRLLRPAPTPALAAFARKHHG